MAALLSVCLGPLAGCGGDDRDQVPQREPATHLGVAIAGAVGHDPLAANDRPTQFALRQIYEPLVGSAGPPFGRTGDTRGLALNLRPNGDATVWTARLRRGVRFSDGSSFNGSAAAINARRWAAESLELIPELVAADAPRADRVRLILSDPVPELPDVLEDPRLGIVAPASLRERSDGTVALRSGRAVGTGPFTITRRRAGGILAERSSTWWGTEAGLGPALSTIAFSVEADAGRRLALLDAGQVEIADEVGSLPRRELRDPLFATSRTPGSLMALERSVRGVAESLPGTPLSGAWLTTVNQRVPG